MTIAREHLDEMDVSELATGASIAHPTPGEILKLEFLDPKGLSCRQLGEAIGVPGNRLSLIVQGKRAITAETAILLSRYFGTSAEFWMGLQTDFDLWAARERMAHVA